MTVELTKEQAQLVQGLVRSGRYQDDSEAVRKGLELLQAYESRLSELRAEIQKGVESGEPSPLDMAAIKAKARELHDQRTTR